MDARRNLESVLRAAREVFGELGYGAPMEEVARRAGVGVGTVYRRFPSKEVLVQRIAAEEVAWLTGQARDALAAGGQGPWDALAGYLSRAVSSGAGRLLPPEAFRYAEAISRGQTPGRPGWPGAPGTPTTPATARTAGTAASPNSAGQSGAAQGGAGQGGAGQAASAQLGGPEAAAGPGRDEADADPTELLGLLGRLVERAREAGELRSGVTVADVVLVLTASVPAYATGEPRVGERPGAQMPQAPQAPQAPRVGLGPDNGFRYPTPDSAVHRTASVPPQGNGQVTGPGGQLPPQGAAPGVTGASSRLLRILLDGLRTG
ncbi:TetR/AcrR family transcriptional regulator [Phaeacidiphilus oryzae]|uniref:TetR/AcrR family transcriptional regulator n=1 Tax=Phaeacidiphilus oryzae TaxID=348818 RepID=UPI0007C679E0|nr:TetR/AcrR family transcriptional regulator [Phaeacidiphilus oryzae]